VRRKYLNCSVEPGASGFGLALDGKPMRTPAGAPLVLPQRALAEAIAEEWNAVPDKGEIRPQIMPMTRLAATAIDRVAPQREKIIADIVAFGGSDLLCYRAERPSQLVERQAAGWDPWLVWIEQRFAVPLRSTQGVMPVAQDEAALERLRQGIMRFDDFALAALFNLTAMLGSAVLALAVLERELEIGEAATLAEIDAAFQAERWGEDRDAVLRREAVRRDIAEVGRFLALLSRSEP
jgi:chaperone required for assembly of F1-ATPase